VFLKGAALADVRGPLVLLLGAVLARAALLWAREVVAGHGAVRVKSVLRERLYAHLLRLGPAYAAGERVGELATAAKEGVERIEPYFAAVPLLVVAYVFPRDLYSGVVLMITHRLVGMEEVDEILVLDAGRIVELGTHEQLRAGGGLYSRMLETQRELLAEPRAS
jgi:ATP-binding cassette, subfamily C, bacterial CydD